MGCFRVYLRDFSNAKIHLLETKWAEWAEWEKGGYSLTLYLFISALIQVILRIHCRTLAICGTCEAELASKLAHLLSLNQHALNWCFLWLCADWCLTNCCLYFYLYCLFFHPLLKSGRNRRVSCSLWDPPDRRVAAGSRDRMPLERKLKA